MHIGGCGACETGTVDSKDAVGELTGMYSQRVPDLQTPQPPICNSTRPLLTGQTLPVVILRNRETNKVRCSRVP